ncbi:LysE family transporter, partial [Micromonospora tarensis]
AGVIAPAAGPLRVVAAVVLLGLAAHGLWRTWAAHSAGETPTARAGRGIGTPGRAYAALLGLTLLNPTTVLYFVALVLGRRDTADAGLLPAALFVAGVVLASASWQLLIAGGGTVVGRALTGPRGRLVTGVLSSALIAALAVAALLPG